MNPSMMAAELSSDFKVTEDNFHDYFHSVKHHSPKKGQIMARWRVVADFVDGAIKRNVIQMLRENKVGAETARSLMVNLISATERDAVKVLLEMASDLLKMSVDKVAENPYRMTIEKFYWTEERFVPKDDPAWEVTKLIDVRDL